MPRVSIPSVSSPLPPDMRAFVQRVREAFSLYGEVYVTAEELEKAGLIANGPNGTIIPGPGVNDQPDYTQPPAPTGLSASGSLTVVILSWDEPTYRNHSYTEIWRSTTDNLGTAVKVGTTNSSVYTDATGSTGITYYYWIRYVSRWDVVGPYNATAGTPATTTKVLGPDIAAGSVAATHLAAALGTRIDLIDASAGVTGSVNERIQTETSARETLATQLRGTYTGNDVTQITTGLLFQERSTRISQDSALSQQISLLSAGVGGGFDASTTWYFDSTVESWTAANGTLAFNSGGAKLTASAADPQFLSPSSLNVPGSKYAGVKARVRRTGTPAWEGKCYYKRTGDATWDEARAKTIAEPTWNSDVGLVTWDFSADANWTGGTIDQIRLDIGSASGSVFELDYVSVGREGPAASVAALAEEASTRATADSANATSITTLQTTVGGHTTSLQTQQTSINGLSAQYTVKIDANGYVTGFGLASEPVNGTPYSTFMVRADAFIISNPAGPGITPVTPFVVVTTPFVKNGVTVPVGIYMGDVFVQNGAIVTAKIGDLAVDTAKLAQLAVTEAKIADGSVTNLKIGNYIQSTGYVPGSAGWIINKDGTAEFNNATFRGGILAGNITSTAGLTVGAGGSIKGGATGFNAGTGFWMGYESGVYKFSLGAAGGARLLWDGSTFAIYDSLNQVVLASGSGVPWSKVSGPPTSLAGINATEGNKLAGIQDGADVTWTHTAAGIQNQGWFATLNQITSSNVATYIANAAIQNAQIGGDIWSSNWNWAQGWYLQRNGNLYCANAYVRGDVEASSLKANAGIVNTLHIAGNAVTIPVAAQTTGAVSIWAGTGQWQDIQSAYIDAGGATVVVMAQFDVQTQVYDANPLARIISPSGAVVDYTGGTNIYADYSRASNKIRYSLLGTNTEVGTYRLQIGGCPYGVSASNRTMLLIGAKR